MRAPGDIPGDAGRARHGSPLRLVAVVALASVVGGATAAVAERAVRPGSVAPTGALHEVLDGRRVANGRLTGGVPHAEYVGPLRSRTRGGAPVAPARAGPAATVLADGVENPSAESLRNVGVLRLAQGRYRLACATLDRSRELAPGDARIAADLAVALLEEAIADNVPQLAARALAVADEAIALDAMVDEAWFTRAAALEHLWIGPAAVAAWYDYLGRDEASPWGIEARRRVCALERLADPKPRAEARKRLDAALAAGDVDTVREVTSAFPHVAQRAAMDRLERDWPAAIGRGDEKEAANCLDAADVLATALDAATQDRFAIDAVESIRRRSGDASSRSQLAAALRDCGQGREAVRSSMVEAAETAFRNALRQLTVAECEPFAMLANADLSRCHVMRARNAEALRVIELVVSQAADRGYRYLEARSRWIAAYIHAVTFEPRKAIAQFDLALSGLKATGDGESASTVAFLLAEASAWYGRDDESWRLTVGALETSWRSGRANAASLEYSEIARRWEADGAGAVARCLGEASIAMGRATGNRVALAGVYASQAARLARGADQAAAVSSIDAARHEASLLPEGEVRMRIGLEIDIAEAEVLVDEPGSGAVERLTQVLDRYATTHDRVRTVECLRIRSAAYAAQGDDASALADLELARDELFEQHARLRSDGQGSASAREVSSVLDLLTERFVRDAKDLDRAFACADLKRSWSSRDWNRETPSSLARVSAQLDATEVVAVYALLQRELVMWSVTRAGSTVVRVPCSSTRLRELLGRFERAVESGETGDMGALSDPLVDILWKPIEGAIDSDATVTIIGGQDLDGFPMGALLDGRTGQFLIERNAFASSSSVAQFVRFLGARQEFEEVRNDVALVVGDPAFDTARFPDLQRLPGAAAEARSVATTYPASICLIGEDATRDAIEHAITGATVIHYAGHAVDDWEHTRESALVLAPADSRSDVIRASEVDRLSRLRAHLVVLAACSSASSHVARPGSYSLAQTFLQAGAHEVVGCHWAIDDTVAATLLPALHANVRNGVSVPQSLRRSILIQLKQFEGSASTPRDWAALAVTR